MINPYLTVGAAVIAFGAGWQVHTWKVNSDEEKARTELIEAHNEQVGRLEQELRDRDRTNFELSVKLDVAQQNVRTEFRTIETKVPEYVPQNTADCNCDLNRGFIGLFNNAATRNKNGATSGPYTPIDLSNEMPVNTSDLAGG